MGSCTKIYIDQVLDDIAAAADDDVVDFCLHCISGIMVPDENGGQFSKDL